MPSSKDYVRNYKQEALTKKRRGEYKEDLARNRNRRQAIKDGKVARNDGNDLSHIVAVSKRGPLTDKKNLKVQTASKNRSYKRKSDGSMA
jgi:hypothetical protein